MSLKSAAVGLIIRIRPRILLKPLESAYELALRSVIRSLRKLDRVAAVYVCGSLARSAVLPALSDIDLKIFLRGKRDPSITEHLLRRLRRLRRVFPMISVSEEIGIHFLENFLREHGHYPLLRHLFDLRFHPRKLVWGEDVLAGWDLSSSSQDEFFSSCLWRFKYWFEKLSCLYGTRAINRAQKRYLFYKAVADIGLIGLILDDPRYAFRGRDEVLRDIQSDLPETERALIDRLLRERKSLFTKGLFDLDQAFSLFKDLVSNCCRKMERDSGTEIVELPYEFRTDPIPPERELMEEIEKALGFEIKTAAMAPTYLATSPLDYETHSLPAYTLLPEQGLTCRQLDALRSLCRNGLKDRISLFVKENEHYVYSAYSHFMDHILEARFDAPLAFELLSPATNKDGRMLTFSAPSLRRLKTKLAHYVEQLEDIIGNREIFKMAPASYFKFFFSALSKLILSRSIRLNAFHLHTEPAAIAGYLVSNLSVSETFINRLAGHAADPKDSGTPPYEPDFGPSLEFLDCFYRVVLGRTSEDELARLSRAEAGAKSTVSVIIVTKSHAEQLARCLHSLAQLDRLPDEVLVVDNDSRDSTRETVLRFRGPFDVRYVHFSGFGIGKVRNAGIREARGDLLVFVDDDATVNKDWLRNLEREFLKNPHLGVCGGSIRNMPMDRRDLAYRYFSMMDLM